MLDCIRSVQAALNSQSLYICYVQENKTFEDPLMKEERETAARAEYWRSFIPEGHHYRPAYIYTQKPVPAGQRVPD